MNGLNFEPKAVNPGIKIVKKWVVTPKSSIWADSVFWRRLSRWEFRISGFFFLPFLEATKWAMILEFSFLYCCVRPIFSYQQKTFNAGQNIDRSKSFRWQQPWLSEVDNQRHLIGVWLPLKVWLQILFKHFFTSLWMWQKYFRSSCPQNDPVIN